MVHTKSSEAADLPGEDRTGPSTGSMSSCSLTLEMTVLFTALPSGSVLSLSSSQLNLIPCLVLTALCYSFPLPQLPAAWNQEPGDFPKPSGRTEPTSTGYTTPGHISITLGERLTFDQEAEANLSLDTSKAEHKSCRHFLH